MEIDINKIIQEQTNLYSERIKKNTSFKSNERIAASAGFSRGATIVSEIILSKWQEANRWRKVSEELPEVKESGVSDYVWTKSYYESYQVAQYCKNKYYPNGSWFNPDRELSITPVEWKPIS